MKEIIKQIKKDTGTSPDIVIRTITINNQPLIIIFNETLSSSDTINDFILKSISDLIIQTKHINDLYQELLNTLSATNITEITTYEEILDFIYKGFTILLVNKNKYIAIETKGSLDRSIATTEAETSITGPKDAFTENFNINVGLIRKRLRTNNLFLEKILLGKQSNTYVGLCYMNNIVDKSLVDKVKKQLEQINIDGIIDSGYIREQLVKKDSFFPVVNSTERPDLVSQALLEGKIALIVDNSPYVLIIPSFFIDFFHTPDDYYQKSINITFIRIIRLIAFIIAIFLPAFYISVTTHNPNSIPIDILINFASQRMNVPFPAFIEAILMILSFEILRESDTRIPSKMGTSVSILGGLVLGEAAVSAGIISPIMIIVIAISAISGLAFTNMSLIYSIRYWRIIATIISAFFGIYGVFISLMLLVTKLCSIDSFGYPYMAPFSPIIKPELKDSIIKMKKKDKNYRNPLLAKKNIVRGK